MFNNPKRTCTTEGCNHKQARGKQLCWRHLKELRSNQVVTKEMQALMRSNCCNTGCVVGEKHEYGVQYCKRCEAACVWKIASGGKATVETK